MKNINILFIISFLLLVVLGSTEAVLTKADIDTPCNQTFTKDTANIYYSNITINWSTAFDDSNNSIDYILNRTNLLVEYNLCNTIDTNCTLTTKNFTSGINGLKLYTCNGLECQYDNSCSITMCTNNWVKQVKPCIVDTKIIEYSDINNCSIQYNLPITNGTYEACQNVIYTQNTYQNDYVILIVLAFFLIIALICAIFVHEGFFGLCALILSLILLVFVTYAYDNILIYITLFMILLFGVMWVVIHKIKRT